MMDPHYIAACIVFAAGLVGCLPVPLYTNASTLAASLIKMFSAGVICSLAFVHMMPEVVQELPYGGICILAGVLGMAILENLSHSMQWIHCNAHESLDVEQQQQQQPTSHKSNNEKHMLLYVVEAACMFIASS